MIRVRLATKAVATVVFAGSIASCGAQEDEVCVGDRDRLLAIGQALFANPDTATLFDLARQLEELPDCPSCRRHRDQAVLFTADLLNAHGHADRGLALLTAAPLAPPTDDSVSSYRIRAGLQLAGGRLQRAREHVERGLERAAEQESSVGGATERTLMRTVLARIESLCGRLDAAHTELARAAADLAEFGPNLPELATARTALAEAHVTLAFTRGDYDAARRQRVPRPLAAAVDALAAFSNGEENARTKLEQVARMPGLTDVQRTHVLSRLTELQIREDDLDAAVATLASIPRSTAGGMVGAIRDATRTAYECEIMLRRTERDAIVHAFNAHLDAVTRLDETLRDVPELERGAGLLQVTDIGFAYAVLLRAEYALLDHARAVDRCIRHIHRLHSIVDHSGFPTSDPAEQVRAMLAADRAQLLVWMPGRLSTTVIYLDAGGKGWVDSLPLHGWRGLGATVSLTRDLAECIHRPRQRAQADQLAARVGKSILPPDWIERLDPEQRVYVSSAAIGLLPIEAFPSGEKVFGAEFAVHHTPLLPRLLRNFDERREAAHDGPRSFAFLGSVAAVPRIGARRLDQDTVTALFRDAGTATPEVWTNGRATVTALADPAIRGVDILHVLGHRSATPGDRHSVSGIAFAPDRLLAGGDVTALDDPPKLVLLSSCGIARGLQRPGSDPLSTTLAGAFMRAGSHAVVAPTCDIPLAGHLERMAGIVSDLTAGRSVGEVMRAARAADPTDVVLLLMQVHGVDR